MLVQRRVSPWFIKWSWYTSTDSEYPDELQLKVIDTGTFDTHWTVNVPVYFKDGGSWHERKAGTFVLTPSRGNFTLVSHTDGWDSDGHWVESQLLTGTVHDATALRVTFVRTVSNLHLARAHESASFSQVSVGMLQRGSSE